MILKPGLAPVMVDRNGIQRVTSQAASQLETPAGLAVTAVIAHAELMARVRAALRRKTEMEPFALFELAIHYERREVTVAARPVRLTATKYELLRILSVNAGRVVTYETLIHQVWLT